MTDTQKLPPERRCFDCAQVMTTVKGVIRDVVLFCPRHLEALTRAPSTSPPAAAQHLSDDLRKVVAFAATCIILFANEGDYFRCLRCDGESLHGRSAATGNVTHVKGCPVLLANEILFLDPQPVAARPDVQLEAQSKPEGSR